MKSRTFGFLAAVTALMSAAPTVAETAAETGAKSVSGVSAQYDFYVGGFRIAEVALTTVLDEGEYEARTNVATRGVLEMLLRGRAASHARGSHGSFGQLVPQGFATRYSSRRGEQSIKILYEDASPSRVEFEPEATDADDHATPRERLGALDPATAAVTALLPMAGADLCNRSIPVFDGKRRFDIIFLPADPERFDDSAPPPQSATPLLRCLGVYERISGFGEDMDEKTRYFPFDVWFEKTEVGVFRAVRVAGSTKLGFAIGNLREE